MWWIAAAAAAELPALVFPLAPSAWARPGRWLDHEHALLSGDAISEADPESFAFGGVLTFDGEILPPLTGGYGAWSWQALPGSPVLAPATGVVTEVAQDVMRCGPEGLDVVVIATRVPGGRLVQILHHVVGVARQVGEPVWAGEEIGWTSPCGMKPLAHEVLFLDDAHPDAPLRIDPFGWALPTPDPIGDDGGMAVPYLWAEPADALVARLGMDHGLPWNALMIDVRVRKNGGGR